MKKAVVTIVSILAFLISKAQVAEFLSLQSATSTKDSTGTFIPANIWIGQEIYINFDLGARKVQFYAKGTLDRDPFILKAVIYTLEENTSPDINNEEMTRSFSGIDKSGRKCVVRLKMTKNEYKTLDGELRVEYKNSARIYKIVTFKANPSLNKS